MVKVAGLAKALRMDFAEVLVSADDAYHMMHRIYRLQISTKAHAAGAPWGGMSMGRAYDESRRDGCLKGASDLVGILADTAASSPNIPNSFGDALLSAVAARRCARGTPLDTPR